MFSFLELLTKIEFQTGFRFIQFTDSNITNITSIPVQALTLENYDIVISAHLVGIF